MKFSDYRFLAKRMMQERKRSSRAIAGTLIFGFILLIPIFAALVGVNDNLTRQMNGAPHLLYYETSTSDYRIETKDRVVDAVRVNVSGNLHLEEICTSKNVSNFIVYESYTLNAGDCFAIGDEDLHLLDAPEMTSFQIVDIDKSRSVFPINCKTDLFVGGYDRGFTDGGKGQVIVTETFLEQIGLTPDRVYLQPLTIATSSYSFQYFQGALCCRYTVVGVLSKDVTDMYQTSEFMSAALYFTSASVYDAEGNGVLKPVFDKEGKKVLERADELDHLNREYMLLGWSPKFSANCADTYAATHLFLEAESYRDLDVLVNGTEAKLQSYFPEEIDRVFGKVSPVYDNFRFTYRLVNMISYLLLTVGLVLIICSFVNYYAVMMHDVNSKQSYLAMLRAIGAKSDAIPKLYLTQAAIMASRAAVWIAPIGFALSAIVKTVLDTIFARGVTSITIGVSWGVIVAATGVGLILVYAVSLLFAAICTRRVSRAKIVDILENS